MIEDRPVANMTDALQGAAPNVVIQQRSSNPNDRKTNFNIRGISTVNDNSPLFVIDGLIADGGSFDKLNPNDIENISILKDAGRILVFLANVLMLRAYERIICLATFGLRCFLSMVEMSLSQTLLT